MSGDLLLFHCRYLKKPGSLRVSRLPLLLYSYIIRRLGNISATLYNEAR